MRFTEIRDGLSKRVLDCVDLLKLIQKSESRSEDVDQVLSSNSKSLKGQIFILMYGAWEYTVSSCLQKIIIEINTSGSELKSIKRNLLSVYLHPEIESMINTNKQKWIRRVSIFKKGSSNEVAINNGYIDVTSGINIKFQQLQIIQECYDMSDPMLPDMRFRGRLDELIENRNAIAHGRLAASEVGNRYTQRDIDRRLEDLNLLCLFFISKGETYIENKEYLLQG
jgi:hypothetical protein